jgi:hypothetical protein
LLYILAVANALLVWTDFTFGRHAGSIALRAAVAFGYAALPFATALICARLFTKTFPNHPTKEALSSFQVNLEIAWSLGCVSLSDTCRISSADFAGGRPFSVGASLATDFVRG